MMISAVAAVGLTALSASATETWILTKANKEYQVDTVAHATVGPGTTLTELVLKGEYLIHAFYTTVDLNNKNVELRALKAGDNRSGLATVPNLATSHDIEGEVKHFAGVNSDFFSMKTPTTPMATPYPTAISFRRRMPLPGPTGCSPKTIFLSSPPRLPTLPM